jgi:hypothetical protein
MLSKLCILAGEQDRDCAHQNIAATPHLNRSCCKRADMFNRAAAGKRAEPSLGEKEIPMLRKVIVATLVILSLPLASSTQAGVRIGVGIGIPVYGGYYGGPYYRPYPYYYPYGPNYYQPAYVAPAPVYAPAYAAPAPVYGQPVYGQPGAPVYSQPAAPSYSQPPSGSNYQSPPAPMYNSATPSSGYAPHGQPGISPQPAPLPQ